MEKGSEVLRIVKEDILEVLKEKNREVSLLLIEPEIRVSRSFISEAVKELEKECLIRVKKNLISLTEEGIGRAENIIKKHRILEGYFRKIRSKKEAYEIASILEHYVSMEVIDNIKKLSTFKKEGIPLTEFKHKEGLITDTTFDTGLFERIISMGILPGEKIRLLDMTPARVIVKVKNKKFALDNNTAKEIRVLKI